MWFNHQTSRAAVIICKNIVADIKEEKSDVKDLEINILVNLNKRQVV
jgi:hypothetical protein